MFRDWGKNDSLLPKYIYICILAASVKLFALCWPCEATTFISASRPSRAGFGCLQTCAMGQFSTSFHESCDLHRHSSLKNNSLTAKPNLLCCSLSPLLLVLFTVHMKTYCSLLEQPSMCLKIVIKFSLSFPLPKDTSNAPTTPKQSGPQVSPPSESIPSSSVAKRLLRRT